VTLQNSGTTISAVDGNVSITGHGGNAGAAGFYTRGILLNDRVSVKTTGSGKITINGTGGTGTSDSRGVEIGDSGTVVTTAAGDIQITGRGGDNVSAYGVWLRNGVFVTAGGAGKVTVDGTAGDAHNGNGVMFQGGGTPLGVSSVDGDITIIGHGGNAGLTGNYTRGVGIFDMSRITSAGTGKISITGTGGTGTDSSRGVEIADSNTAITSAVGDIQIKGQGGADAYGFGVWIHNSVIIQSTNSAKITIDGTGGANGINGEDDGVMFNGFGTFGTTKITSLDGDISVIGRGGNSADNSFDRGVAVFEGAVIESTGTAKITIDGASGSARDGGRGVEIGDTNTKVTSARGDISITGHGGSSFSTGFTYDVGVWIRDNAVVSSTATSGLAARITIDGIGGAGSGVDIGVWMTNFGMVSSVLGDIQITGQGAASPSGPYNYGVGLENGVIASNGAAKINVTGNGGAGSSVNRGVVIAYSGARIQSVGGDIQVTGTGASATTGTGYDNGVEIVIGAKIVGLGAAKVTVNGSGGTQGDNDNGILVSDPNSEITSENGDLTIIGTGGGAGDSNDGVHVASGALIRSTGTGAISVSATQGTGPNSQAIDVSTNGAITAITNPVSRWSGEGNANDSVDGNSGTLNGTSFAAGQVGQAFNFDGNHYVSVPDATNLEFTNTLSIEGWIYLTGDNFNSGLLMKGDLSNNQGVYSLGFFTGSSNKLTFRLNGSTSEGSGQVTGNTSLAVGQWYHIAAVYDGFKQQIFVNGVLDGSTAYSASINTNSQPLIIGGYFGNLNLFKGRIDELAVYSHAISLTQIQADFNQLPQPQSSITLIGDSLQFDATASVDAGANRVTIRQSTNGTAINLGGTDSSGTLGLTDAELDRVNAGELVIGNGLSGTITVSSNITRPSSSNMQLVSGGDVVLSGGQINTGGGSLSLDPGVSPNAVRPFQSGNDVTASTLTLGGDLAIEIDGPVVDTDYTQLKVVGSIDLTGVNLIVSGSYVPLGTDTFILVNNDGTDPVIGTFNGLPEGAIVSINGINKRITYSGGTNSNDVVFLAANTPPFAFNGNLTTEEDTAKGGTVIATDVDGNSMTYSQVAGPTHGSLAFNSDGTFLYTPESDYHGPDSFTYHANDGTADSNTSTVSITVNAINDAPVAQAQSITTNEDTAKSGTVVATDVDGNSLTYSQVTGPTHGSLTFISDGTFIYTPESDYHGPDSFTYHANDGTADSNAATVSITVNAINDAPVAQVQSITTNEDTAKGGTVIATDVDGNSLTYSRVTGPAHGSLTLNPDGTFNYTPALSYNGPDSFTFRANDGTADSNTATVSITVNAINDAPSAQPQSITTNEDSAKSGTVMATDVDGNALTYGRVAGPTHGSLTFNADGTFTYTPALDYHGPDSFTYRANDGIADSNTATVSITVNAADRVPPAVRFDAVPEIRTTALGIVTLNFTEEVSGFDLADLSLTRNGSPVSLAGLSLNQISSTRYTIDLTSVTAVGGDYVLKLTAAGSGIADAASNGLTTDAVVSWSNLQITGFLVQNGESQRSFVRYLDVTFAGTGGLTALLASGRVKLTQYDLNGLNPVSAGSGSLSIVGNHLRIDLGAQGVGGNRLSTAFDGYYKLTLDLDGDNAIDASRSFYRLLGDLDGNQSVDNNDVSLLSLAIAQPYNALYDIDGNGVLNANDKTKVQVSAKANRKLLNTLRIDG
jgi:VCBS repeat-containing protein